MTETSQPTVPEVAQKLYELLENLESSDRNRAVAGALAMLGETQVPAGAGQGQGRPPDGGPATPVGGSGGAAPANVREFFEEKDPQTNAETLAVAARYRELNNDAHEHTKDDLESVIREARRDPPANYTRDMSTAKDAALFNRAKENPLSAYGQNYVDALPDRESAKAIKPPRGGASKKKASKKKATKKKKSSSKKKSSADPG